MNYKILFTCASLVLLLSCGQQKEPTTNQDERIQEENNAYLPFAGTYVTSEYDKRAEGYDWVGVRVQASDDDRLRISVRSRADKKRPTCTFDTEAYRQDESVYLAVVSGKEIRFTLYPDSLNIAPVKPEDGGILNFYCSGGGSLAGTYLRIDGQLDRDQVDPTLFSKVLMLQDIGFNVTSKPQDGKTVLSIQSFGLSITNDEVTHEINGTVVGAEVEDMNADGSPELMVYIQSGPDNKGTLIGYSVNSKKSMSQVSFPELTGDAAKGYAGNDEFSIVEQYLSRRFPIEGSNKLRQINYQLVDGEASRKLRVLTIEEIPIGE